MTASPQTSANGTYHGGLISMDFDPVSNLRQKLPPVYDGLWTGINTLQLLQGRINGTQRAFAFTFNLTTGKIELYELFRSGAVPFDNGRIPMLTTMESPVMFNKDVKPLTELIRLEDGEIYIQDVIGVVGIEVQYRPDFYPGWTTWRKFSVCSQNSAPVVTLTNGSGLPGNGNYGTPYSFQFITYGGIAPYTFVVSDGTLPPGLTLSTAGMLSGTPTTTGTSTFTVEVADSSAPPNVLTMDCTITIGPMQMTIQADNLSKKHHQSDPSLTYTITKGSVVAGDTLSGSLQRAAGETVGTYAITQNVAFSISSNYVITFVAGTFTVAQSIFDSTPFNWTLTTGGTVSGGDFNCAASGNGGTIHIGGSMTCPDNRACAVTFAWQNTGSSHYQLNISVDGVNITNPDSRGSAPHIGGWSDPPVNRTCTIQFAAGKTLSFDLTASSDAGGSSMTFIGYMYEP
jgi:hypothetical protein